MGKSDILNSNQIIRIDALKNAVSLNAYFGGSTDSIVESVVETARTFESYIRNGAK